eukprot:534130-Pyramimonas_sp.AAC.1
MGPPACVTHHPVQRFVAPQGTPQRPAGQAAEDWAVLEQVQGASRDHQGALVFNIATPGAHGPGV